MFNLWFMICQGVNIFNLCSQFSIRLYGSISRERGSLIGNLISDVSCQSVEFVDAIGCLFCFIYFASLL